MSDSHLPGDNLPEENSREAMEARLTALTLGELSAEEEGVLRAEMAKDPELAKLQERLARTIGLIGEAAGSLTEETAPQAEPLKLSTDRREKLLESFKVVRPKELVKRRRLNWRLKSRELAALAAMVIALLAIGATLMVQDDEGSFARKSRFGFWSEDRQEVAAILTQDSEAEVKSRPGMDTLSVLLDSDSGVQPRGSARRTAQPNRSLGVLDGRVEVLRKRVESEGETVTLSVDAGSAIPAQNHEAKGFDAPAVVSVTTVPVPAPNELGMVTTYASAGVPPGAVPPVSLAIPVPPPVAESKESGREHYFAPIALPSAGDGLVTADGEGTGGRYKAVNRSLETGNSTLDTKLTRDFGTQDRQSEKSVVADLDSTKSGRVDKSPANLFGDGRATQMISDIAGKPAQVALGSGRGGQDNNRPGQSSSGPAEYAGVSVAAAGGARGGMGGGQKLGGILAGGGGLPALETPKTLAGEPVGALGRPVATAEGFGVENNYRDLNRNGRFEGLDELAQKPKADQGADTFAFIREEVEGLKQLTQPTGILAPAPLNAGGIAGNPTAANVWFGNQAKPAATPSPTVAGGYGFANTLPVELKAKADSFTSGLQGVVANDLSIETLRGDQGITAKRTGGAVGARNAIQAGAGIEPAASDPRGFRTNVTGMNGSFDTSFYTFAGRSDAANPLSPAVDPATGLPVSGVGNIGGTAGAVWASPDNSEFLLDAPLGKQRALREIQQLDYAVQLNRSSMLGIQDDESKDRFGRPALDRSGVDAIRVGQMAQETFQNKPEDSKSYYRLRTPSQDFAIPNAYATNNSVYNGALLTGTGFTAQLWAAPADDFQSLKYQWRTINPKPEAGAGNEVTAKPEVANLVQDGKLLLEAGKDVMAEAKPRQALQIAELNYAETNLVAIKELAHSGVGAQLQYEAALAKRDSLKDEITAGATGGVYSQKAVGYINVPITNGFSLAVDVNGTSFGKFAVIRGLNDGYISTTPNGANLPPADPYRQSAVKSFSTIALPKVLEQSLAEKPLRIEAALKESTDKPLAQRQLTEEESPDKKELARLLEVRDRLYGRVWQEKVDQAIPRDAIVEVIDPAVAEPVKKSGLWNRVSGILGSDSERTVKLAVEKDATDIESLGARAVGGFDPFWVQTQSEKIQSKEVLGKVIEKLNLNEAWAGKEGQKLSTGETFALLKKRLVVRQDPKSNFFDITAKSDDPEEAARIANAVAAAYRQTRLDRSSKLSEIGLDRLEKEMAAQNKQIAELQAKIESNKKQTNREEADVPLPKLAPTAAIPQPEVTTKENAFSTFSLNVSDVSFKLAAAALEKGQMPDPATVRSEEFINAFGYHDPDPAGSAPVAFAWERARYPFAHNRDLLRFSIKTAASGRLNGRALNLVLLLDNSGSMERADRVRIIQECLRVLATQLRPEDRVSVVAFARTARLWIDGMPGDQAGELAQRVGTLTPQGGTNLEEAMNLAYQTALRHFMANGVNRVVLLTDGAANLGDVQPASLKKKVETHRQQGIALDCFGIGWEGFNDDLLENLSRNGDGRYGFVNSPAAATTEFAGQLAGALQVAASDVKVQVEFNPKRVTSFRQIGYAKHQLKKEQFRDNTVDAAEIAAAEAGNALYTVEVNPSGEGPVATVRVRFKIPGSMDFREHEWAVPYEGPAKSLEQSTATLRLAGAASAFSEWLVSSPFAGEVTTDALIRLMSGVPESFYSDPRPKKLVEMLRQAKSLSGK